MSMYTIKGSRGRFISFIQQIVIKCLLYAKRYPEDSAPGMSKTDRVYPLHMLTHQGEPEHAGHNE